MQLECRLFFSFYYLDDPRGKRLLFGTTLGEQTTLSLAPSSIYLLLRGESIDERIDRSRKASFFFHRRHKCLCALFSQIRVKKRKDPARFSYSCLPSSPTLNNNALTFTTPFWTIAIGNTKRSFVFSSLLWLTEREKYAKLIAVSSGQEGVVFFTYKWLAFIQDDPLFLGTL